MKRCNFDLEPTQFQCRHVWPERAVHTIIHPNLNTEKAHSVSSLCQTNSAEVFFFRCSEDSSWNRRCSNIDCKASWEFTWCFIYSWGDLHTSVGALQSSKCPPSDVRTGETQATWICIMAERRASYVTLHLKHSRLMKEIVLIFNTECSCSCRHAHLH